MGLEELQYEEGQTPLDPDEKDGLLIPTVSTRSELDEVEQRNIEEAIRWTLERRKRFSVEEIFSEQFVMELHRRMYGEAWKWAGDFRDTNKNIGVDEYQIGTGIGYRIKLSLKMRLQFDSNTGLFLFIASRTGMEGIRALQRISLLRRYLENLFLPGGAKI